MLSSGKRDSSIFIYANRGSAEIIVLNVHHNHGGVLGGEGAVDKDFETCDICRWRGDVAWVVEFATADGESNTFLLLFVWFVITYYFAVSDISVIWDVFQFDEETCVGSWNVSNSLEEASAFVAKTSSPTWLEMGILHESWVFHFFASDWVDDCVGLVPLWPIVISEGNYHMGWFHSAYIILRQAAWQESLCVIGHPQWWFT
jgi:hypothetical protein